MIDPIIITSMSGGKDSTATAMLALDDAGHDNCRFVFADTGNEHHITLEYLDYLRGRLSIQIDTVRADFSRQIEGKRRYVELMWPRKGVDDATVQRALNALHPRGIPFLDLCVWKGRFPSRMAQFCTEQLKRLPLDAYIRAIIAQGHEVESWQGVRRDESQARRHVLDEEIGSEGWLIVRPIASWTAAQVFDFIASRGVDQNPLYRLGMGRVGCMPCVNCQKDELLEISKRFPEYIDMKDEWEAIVSAASKRGYATFFFSSGDDFTDLSDAEIFDLCNIRERVQWAQTSYGGKQFDLIRIMAPEACSSRYGLCE